MQITSVNQITPSMLEKIGQTNVDVSKLSVSEQNAIIGQLNASQASESAVSDVSIDTGIDMTIPKVTSAPVTTDATATAAPTAATTTTPAPATTAASTAAKASRGFFSRIFGKKVGGFFDRFLAKFRSRSTKSAESATPAVSSTSSGTTT